MKKVLTIIIILIIYLLIYFLQTNFFNWFTIMDIKPNLFIIFLVFIGLYMGEIYGAILGGILGLILDLYISKIIGVNGVMLAIAGFLAGVQIKNFSKDSKITVIIILMLITLITEILSYFIRIVVEHISIDIIAFLEIVLIEMIYNALILIIVYPIFQKIGNKIQIVFTKNNILTRYF